MAEYETISLTLVGFPPARGKPNLELSILAQTQKGSGLAFHTAADEPDSNGPIYNQEIEEDVYIITQISSGKRLSREGVATPRQAKLWVGLLCRICDWNKDLTSILADARGENQQEKVAALARQIEAARLEAIEQTFFVVRGD